MRSVAECNAVFPPVVPAHLATAECGSTWFGFRPVAFPSRISISSTWAGRHQCERVVISDVLIHVTHKLGWLWATQNNGISTSAMVHGVFFRVVPSMLISNHYIDLTQMRVSGSDVTLIMSRHVASLSVQ